MLSVFRFVVSVILTLSLLAILIWLPMRHAEPIFILVWVICVILCFYIGFLLRNTTATMFFLVLGGIIGALAISEAFLFALSVYGPDDKRVLMYDRFPLRLEDDGTVLYSADTKFTEILSRGNKIGYIKSYRTNNFGLRDEVDYPLGNSKRHIVFVGDSFTASQGSSFSWVSKLSRELEKKGISIYNLGVFGTGLIHFEKILRHFKDKISFDEIVLVTISDDFMRPYWFPQQEDNRVLFCSKDTTRPCKGIGVVDPSYVRELSEKRSVGLELNELEMPLQRHQSKSDGRTTCRWDFGLPVLLKCIARKSLFLVLIKKELINPLSSPLNSTEFKNSISALKQIRLSFPDKKISLIQLPQRNEVMTKQYKLNLKKHVEAADMEYHTALTACGLSQDDFNDYDSHPTEHGYDKIAACVSKLLQLAL